MLFVRPLVRRPGAASLVRPAVVALAVALTLAGALALGASAGPVDPIRVKAAFVLNFLKFVEWPSGTPGAPRTPVVIAVLGDDRIHAELEQAARAPHVEERPLVVRRVATAEEAIALQARVLFIGASAAPGLPGTLHALENHPVLTVGDTTGFAEAGVILNLYEFDRRVRIEVNNTAAARVRLRLSAHLLRIARIVG